MDEGLRSELSKQGIYTATLEELYNWSRKNSVWPLQFGLACCAIEMIAATMARYDLARFGAEVFRSSPRQADLMIVAGTVTKKMAPRSCGSTTKCRSRNTSSRWAPVPSVAVLSYRATTCSKALTATSRWDVHIPGCPPRPEALIHAFMTLQRNIDEQKLTGPNRSRHLVADAPSEFPVPQFGEHDLVPSKNAELWQPPKPVGTQ